MPNKAQFFAELADRQTRNITGSRKNWIGFLETAGRLYKYPFEEQLMIHAQRPDARACASFDLWHEPMNRYIKRGSKGIALLDMTSGQPKLKYVFDYADTEDGRRNPRRPFIWELKPEHEQPVLQNLADSYDISDSENNIRNMLYELAESLSALYYEDNARDIGQLTEAELFVLPEVQAKDDITPVQGAAEITEAEAIETVEPPSNPPPYFSWIGTRRSTILI